MRVRDQLLGVLRSDKEVWSQFTKEEEYAPKETDQYGRFPSKATRHGNVLEPKVSRYLFEKGFRATFPEGKTFGLCLTHDIDLLKPQTFRNIRIPASARKLLKRTSSKFRTAWDFKGTMDLEEDFGAKSTFFFMALASGEEDHNYGLSDVGPEIASIRDRGWEIGLHGGHKASLDSVALRAEKARLEKAAGVKVLGCRNHYLKIKVPTTWRYQIEAGFEYDSTLGFADSIGFRNGMCHPFIPFDLKACEPLDIVELPLGVMDGSLFDYMGLDPGRAWEAARPLIDSVAGLGGVLTVLWHNTHMQGEYLDFYRKMLEYCSRKGAWMAPGRDFERWWRTDPYAFE